MTAPNPTPIPGLPPEGEGENGLVAASKVWWKSRTLWFNALCAVMAALEAGTGLLAQLFTPQVYPAVALLIAVINGVLRVITTQGVCAK